MGPPARNPKHVITSPGYFHPRKRHVALTPLPLPENNQLLSAAWPARIVCVIGRKVVLFSYGMGGRSTLVRVLRNRCRQVAKAEVS